MGSSRGKRSRDPLLVGSLLLVVVSLVGVAVAAWISATRPDTETGGSTANVTMSSQAPTKPVGTFPLPPDPHLLIVGDSWSYGQGASPRTLGYAYVTGQLMGWPTEVSAVPGTGYTTVSPYNYPDNGTFFERFSRLAQTLSYKTPNIIIVQGSLNDTHTKRVDVAVAEIQTINELKALFPGAAIVVFGPIFDPKASTQAVDDWELQLLRAAVVDQVAFINPMQPPWITTDMWPQLTGTDNHPNTQGHEFIANQLAGALRTIFQLPEQ